MKPDTLNIYQKLLEVRKAVPYLKKDNAGFNFKFVSSSQTLGSLRDAMDAHNLLLVPEVVASEVRDHTTARDKHEYFTILTMKFTWINADNPTERIECPWYGQGLDDGEKGVGKALTYAEKYFLLKFFNIATDKDDPDNFQKQPEPSKPPKETKPTIDEMRKEMAEWFGEKYTTDAEAKFSEMTQGNFSNPLTIKTDKNVQVAYDLYLKYKKENN